MNRKEAWAAEVPRPRPPEPIAGELRISERKKLLASIYPRCRTYYNYSALHLNAEMTERAQDGVGHFRQISDSDI
jgi:hypothetical protein